MSRELDLVELTRPDGIVPVNVETTAGLVREVLRLRAALQAISDIEDKMEGGEDARMIARAAIRGHQQSGRKE